VSWIEVRVWSRLLMFESFHFTFTVVVATASHFRQQVRIFGRTAVISSTWLCSPVGLVRVSSVLGVSRGWWKRWGVSVWGASYRHGRRRRSLPPSLALPSSSSSLSIALGWARVSGLGVFTQGIHRWISGHLQHHRRSSAAATVVSRRLLSLAQLWRGNGF